jgi:hypothetical protein
VFRGSKAVRAYPVLTCGPELDGLVEAMADCEDLDSQVVAVASLAAHLVCWHYDLTDTELDGLLCFRAADETSLNWLREVVSIATGHSGPKAFRAGDA